MSDAEEPIPKKIKQEDPPLDFNPAECLLCGNDTSDDSFHPESDKIYTNISDLSRPYLARGGQCQAKYRELLEKNQLLPLFLEKRPSFHFECLANLVIFEPSPLFLPTPALPSNPVGVEQAFLNCFVCNKIDNREPHTPQRDTIYQNCIKLLNKFTLNIEDHFGEHTVRLFNSDQLSQVIFQLQPRYHKECWLRVNEVLKIHTHKGGGPVESKLPYCFVCNEGDEKNELITPLRNTMYLNCYRLMRNKKRSELEKHFAKETLDLYFNDQNKFTEILCSLRPLYHKDCWIKLNQQLKYSTY